MIAGTTGRQGRDTFGEFVDLRGVITGIPADAVSLAEDYIPKRMCSTVPYRQRVHR